MTAKLKTKRRVLRMLILIALMVIVVSLIVEKNLNQMMLDMAYAQAYSMAVETINKSVREVMQGGVTYEDLITMHLDAEGRVTTLNANTIRMNELATRIALLAEAELERVENTQIQIPIGSAFGVQFLAGSGPKISLKIIPIGSVSTHFATEFESAGINQTRHKISLVLSTTVRLVIPTGSKRVEVTSTMPIAETIIVGTVPDSYVDVNNTQDLLNLLP